VKRRGGGSSLSALRRRIVVDATHPAAVAAQRLLACTRLAVPHLFDGRERALSGSSGRARQAACGVKAARGSCAFHVRRSCAVQHAAISQRSGACPAARSSDQASRGQHTIDRGRLRDRNDAFRTCAVLGRERHFHGFVVAAADDTGAIELDAPHLRRGTRICRWKATRARARACADRHARRHARTHARGNARACLGPRRPSRTVRLRCSRPPPVRMNCAALGQVTSAAHLLAPLRPLYAHDMLASVVLACMAGASACLRSDTWVRVR
jgi:hypothetical protein